MPTDVAVGTYSIDSVTYRGEYVDSSNGTPQIFIGDSGSITINSHDTVAKTISGTFNFLATPIGDTTPQYNVSEGTFDTSY